VAPLDVVDVVDSVVTVVAAEVVEVCSPIFSKLQKSTRVVRACDDACSLTTSGLVCKTSEMFSC
jgi:hypothetical protein